MFAEGDLSFGIFAYGRIIGNPGICFPISWPCEGEWQRQGIHLAKTL